MRLDRDSSAARFDAFKVLHAAGWPDTRIAAALGLSERSVRHYRIQARSAGAQVGADASRLIEALDGE